MSARADVLLWAQRVLGRKDSAPHQILEIAPDAPMADVQAAFHGIARRAHPDLHRTTLEHDELELVTKAYAVAAGAYQDCRTQCLQSGRSRALREEPVGTPRTGTRTAPPPMGGPVSAVAAMHSKALIYYRKAEISLRRGDLRGGLLQVKMAIAADPQSAFLRTALAEIEAELAKNP